MNQCAPRFLLPLSGTIEVAEGESFVLEVRVHGHPTPEVEWYKNGVEILSGYYSAQGKCELRISNITQHHTGEYRCSAVNTNGRVSSAMWLAVVPKNYMSPTLNRHRVKPNRSGSGNPANFYFNNPVKTELKEEVQLKRTGSLDCIATSVMTDLPENFKRPVSPRRRAPGFLARPSSCTLTPGSKLHLSAKLLGHPPPKVLWEKEGFQLCDTDERVQIVSKGNIHSLEIDSVNYTDSGSYRIIARNPLGRQHAQASVVVDKNALSESFNMHIQNDSPSVTENPNDVQYIIRKSVVADSRSPRDDKRRNYFEGSVPTNLKNSPMSPARSLPSDCANDYLNARRCNSPLSKFDGSMKQLCSPKIIVHLEDKVSNEGDVLTLHCRITGGTETRWTLNGDDIRSVIKKTTQKFVTRQFGEIHRLRITNFDPSMAGEYAVHVSNKFGSVTDACYVLCHTDLKGNDQSLKNIPIFEQGLRDVAVNEGEAIILRVKVSGNPVPTVRFFFEDERFISDPKNGITILAEGSIHKLILEDANMDDAGNYSCLARNELGNQIETYCHVIISRKPPVINYISTDTEVYYGEPFVVEVETDGELVTWSYDASLPEMLSDTRYRFAVKSATNGGNIIITSSNGESSTTTATTTLNILQKQILPPKIECFLITEKEIELNDRATFPLEYSGEQVTVKWLFNNLALSSEFQVTQSTTRNKHITTAIIGEMKSNLDGELTCFLTNESGTAKSSCLIRFARKVPVFISTPDRSYNLMSDEKLTLTFEFDGVPIPETLWSKSNRTQIFGEISNTNRSSMLEFNPITIQDDGCYVFRIQNEAGFAQFTISIVVKALPPLQVLPVDEEFPARIIERLTDKTFAEGEDIVLRCRVEGQPTPIVSWSLGDEAIWHGPPDEGGLSELILKDCWSDDMGIYKIQVVNKLGKDDSSCNVIVQQRLKPMIEPLGPLEPMETILEVSEMSSRATSADHSRTTSTDSHKTETQTTGLCLENLKGRIECPNDIVLPSTPYKRPPYFVTKPVNTEIGDGEKNFCWDMRIIDATSVSVCKMVEETKVWDELDLTEGDFSIIKTGDVYQFKLKEVFPDDAGKYKFQAVSVDGECEEMCTLSVIPAEGIGPCFITKPRSREFSLGNAAVFSCVVSGDPLPSIKWEINGASTNPSRMGIHESLLEDKTARSELTIKNLASQDVGRGIVMAQNIHDEISCQFSILLSSNEEPVTLIDFRSQLKNKVETKAVTAEDLLAGPVQQLDFRSNLKKSKTTENLSEIQFEESAGNRVAPVMDPELAEKLNNQLRKFEEPNCDNSESVSTSVFEVSESTSATFIVPDEFTSLMKSDDSWGSSSKASTVLNSALNTDVVSECELDTAEILKPYIRKGLKDQAVPLSTPFCLSVVVENSDNITWMFEQEIIEAEPDEGLIIQSNGDEHMLLVSSSMTEDMGTYDVIVENRYGERRSNCFVTIIDS